ncbi:glycosyltransferase family 2 protein [uncultured Roseovarius sp.]|uniref:glycosyltransferase family 2 protein n=1 Tax=uncultured Roseovarius sp. TaxID=293344 RepID=UPI002637F9D4|nr:glycosyltransferase family 2 protein [uncultured Roseovarius sp.]
MAPVPTESDVSRIRNAALFDACWYQRRYPDVARLQLEPAAHFAMIGAFLQRDPGPNFSTRFYLRANPDVAAAGLNPLLHYLSTGQAEGRLPHPGALPARQPEPLRRLIHMRALMETGGLDAGPRAALEELAVGKDGPEAAANAAEALAFAALQDENFTAAVRWLKLRLRLGADAAARLAPVLSIATARSGDTLSAKQLLDWVPESAGLHLAQCWTVDDIEARLTCVNTALAQTGLAPVSLAPGSGAAIDRLSGAAPFIPAQGGVPLISVLMAVHDSESTIRTALSSIQAQTWTDFELLVIDDASTDATTGIVAEYAARDPRIRLLPLARNVGAYGARNAGLAEARGRFVTLHDADDWSHPERLAQQARFMLENPGFAGCLGQHVRCTPDLRVSRWTGTGDVVFENMNSLMLPTDLVRSCLGGWDEVRVSADSELLRRTQRLFGDHAVATLETGPVALLRDSMGSATADGASGMGWFYYGARREYYEAQQHHHAKAKILFYEPGGARPFPAPNILLNRAAAHREIVIDHVYAGLLSVHDASLDVLLTWLEEDRAGGRTAALVPLYSLSMPAEGGLAIHPSLRAQIDGKALRVLCYGEHVRCNRYFRLPGQDVNEVQRYLPQVHAGARRVLAPGQPPAETGQPAATAANSVTRAKPDA